MKRVMLTYNQNGTSRGIASIVFSKPDTAAKAAKELNGLLVDGKPMKVFPLFVQGEGGTRLIWADRGDCRCFACAWCSRAEASDGACCVSAFFLRECVLRADLNSGQAKTQPKPATAAKTSRRSRRGARRGGRVSNRPKPKSAQELDAEMDDYFDTNENAPAEGNAAVNGQAQPATNGGGEDVGMAEISVSPTRNVDYEQD